MSIHKTPLSYPTWTPKFFRTKVNERFKQDYGLADASPSALRKLGFSSLRLFNQEQENIRDALYQIASSPNMKEIWAWFSKHEAEIIYCNAMYQLIGELFYNWRFRSKQTNSYKKKSLQQIDKFAKKLADELVHFESERDSPINEMNVYLMNHRWIDQPIITRNNIHCIDTTGKPRLGALIATAQQMPTLTTLLNNLQNATKQALAEIEKTKGLRRDNIHIDNAFRNFSVLFVERFLTTSFPNFPTKFVGEIVAAIFSTEKIDSRKVSQLRKGR